MVKEIIKQYFLGILQQETEKINRKTKKLT